MPQTLCATSPLPPTIAAEGQSPPEISHKTATLPTIEADMSLTKASTVLRRVFHRSHHSKDPVPEPASPEDDGKGYPVQGEGTEMAQTWIFTSCQRRVHHDVPG